MEIFLPIAEVYVNLPFLFILSLVVGILSGLFGVGGGVWCWPEGMVEQFSSAGLPSAGQQHTRL